MRRGKRGIATVTAMGLIALVAMALTTMMWRIGHEAGELRVERREAELRQLLLAGGAASLGMVGGGEERRTLALPAALRERGGRVALRLGDGRGEFERRVHVEAELEGAVRGQTLRFIRGQQGWALVEAVVGEAPAAGEEGAAKSP